jgi:hypothetical protein
VHCALFRKRLFELEDDADALELELLKLLPVSTRLRLNSGDCRLCELVRVSGGEENRELGPSN